MKLITYYLDEGIESGIVTDQGVVSLNTFAKKSGTNYGETVESVIKSDQFLQFKTDFLKIENELIENDFLNIESLRIAPPVTKPEKIICVGLNYLDHVSEGPNLDVPKEPLLFSKFNNALAAHNEDIEKPLDGYQIDYECELVIVIGKTAKDVSVENAMDIVFGYSIGNDLSVRDLQFRSGQWLLGKSIDKFAPLGPTITTSDSIDPTNLAISTKRNGEIVQQSNTNKMIFSCAQIISYISKYMTLQPGDLIYTGTPEGVVLGYDEGAQDWLDSGDEIEITIEGLGSLVNRIK